MKPEESISKTRLKDKAELLLLLIGKDIVQFVRFTKHNRCFLFDRIEVHLELDSSQCRTNPSMKCLTKIESAVQIIAAQKNQSWSHGGPTISRVSSGKSKKLQSNTKMNIDMIMVDCHVVIFYE